MKKLSAAALIATVLAASSALAEEPGGTVEGTLGGVAFNCEISLTQSDFSTFGSVTSVSIGAWRCQGIEGIDTLMLGFDLAFDKTDRLEIRLRGTGPALYGGGDAGAGFTELETNTENGVLTLSGRIVGGVAPSQDHGSTLQSDQAQPLEITFSAVIAALEL